VRLLIITALTIRVSLHGNFLLPYKYSRLLDSKQNFSFPLIIVKLGNNSSAQRIQLIYSQLLSTFAVLPQVDLFIVRPSVT